MEKLIYSDHKADNDAEKIIKINDMKSNILVLLNPTETALKSKYVRIIISHINQLGMAELFWSIIIDISENNLFNNHISTWKLCQLIHQVLNKGSKLCCYYGAQQYINYLLNISTKYKNYTGDKYDNYGICIIKYIHLLVIKLKFHSKNHKIPTNLSVSKEHFEGNFGEDFDGLFQLAVEIFDYLDGIIDLQNAIFTTNLTYSIAPVMECRFMALTTLIEESKLLYFNVVEIMHNLHMHFSFEILSGHRNRFKNIFKDVKTFFDRTITLNLLQNIMWIPKMKDNPPEFHTKSDIISTNNNTKPIIQQKSTINNHEIQPPYNFNGYNDENIYYDSDFDSSTDDDDENPTKFNRQNISSGQSPSNTKGSPSAPSLDMLLQDKEEIIRKLKHRIEILEQKLSMKDFEISEMKNKLKNSKHDVQHNGVLNTNNTTKIKNVLATPCLATYKPTYDASNPFINQFEYRKLSLISQSNGNLHKQDIKINNKYPEVPKKPILPNTQTNNFSRLFGTGTLPKKQSDYQRSKSTTNVNYGTIPKRINNNQNVNKPNVENRRSVNFSQLKSYWVTNSTIIRNPEE